MIASRQGGYIALLTVLITGAVAVAIALSLLLSGTDRSRELLISQQGIQARLYATTCVEEALQQIHDAANYTGSTNLSQTNGSCSYSVTLSSQNNYTITTSGTVGTTVRKLQVYATISSSSISITSWQEVG